MVSGKSRVHSSIEIRLENDRSCGPEGRGVPPRAPLGRVLNVHRPLALFPITDSVHLQTFHHPMKGQVTSGDLTRLKWNMAAPKRSSLIVLVGSSQTRRTGTPVLGQRELMRLAKLLIKTYKKQLHTNIPTVTKKEHRGGKIRAAVLSTGESHLSCPLLCHC